MIITTKDRGTTRAGSVLYLKEYENKTVVKLNLTMIYLNSHC